MQNDRKLVFVMTLMIVLICMLSVAFEVKRIKATETIYIMANGSVYPSTANITSIDNVTYTFTTNIYDKVVVERDNIVVDGAGYILQGPGNGTGIRLLGISNVTIKNVEIKDFFNGISISYSSNITVHENNITNNWNGIELRYSLNNTIYRNNVTINEYGIWLNASSNNSIIGNNITNNDWDGIRIRMFSNNNTISGNNITKNQYGINLTHSSNNNTISGNNITGNSKYGIYLTGTSNNTIYHNNFVDNAVQVNNYNSTNIWDNGYPSGGNYWSDYAERYPNATEIDESGIWDTPYVIDENNQDNYPLVPEFPTWTSILLPLIVLTVAIAIYKRRLLKTLIR